MLSRWPANAPGWPFRVHGGSDDSGTPEIGAVATPGSAFFGSAPGGLTFLGAYFDGPSSDGASDDPGTPEVGAVATPVSVFFGSVPGGLNFLGGYFNGPSSDGASDG